MRIRLCSRAVQPKEIVLLIGVVLLLFLVMQEDEVSEFIKTSTEYIPPVIEYVTSSIRTDENVTKPKYFVPRSSKKKDWQNYTFIKYEKEKEGLGEQGLPASVPNEEEKEIFKNFYEAYGFNAALSDYISLNRSLPDVRHRFCRTKRYLEYLPTVSVVVPFCNEHLSVLLRTAHSVVYRSPEQLLKEVILIDYGSLRELIKDVEEYVKEHLPKVKVMSLSTTGVVEARQAGAKEATGDVIVFIDSRVEVNVNWLPPLLEPIAFNYRVVVCPVIDIIDFDSFEYKENDKVVRNGFNWEFFNIPLPMLRKDLINMPEPFQSPVVERMLAMSKVFFWEIGGYDPGLQFWGGEQCELSFKVWQCGGGIMFAPCSRVGLIYHKFIPLTGINVIPGNFLERNYHRIAEVWMDEYKQYVYARQPGWLTVRAGDLTEQKELRQKLKCKPFKWYMTQIAFDVPSFFPMVEPEPFASGRVRPISNSSLCVEVQQIQGEHHLTLAECSEKNEQKFVLTWHKDVMLKDKKLCWDVPISTQRGPVKLFECHYTGGNQEWRYDKISKIFRHFTKNCLDHDPITRELFVSYCIRNPETQRWNIDTVNKEMMAQWDYMTTATGPVEEWID